MCNRLVIASRRSCLGSANNASSYHSFWQPMNGMSTWKKFFQLFSRSQSARPLCNMLCKQGKMIRKWKRNKITYFASRISLLLSFLVSKWIEVNGAAHNSKRTKPKTSFSFLKTGSREWPRHSTHQTSSANLSGHLALNGDEIISWKNYYCIANGKVN